MKIGKWILVGIMLGLFLPISANFATADGEDTSLADIIEAGKIVVGTNAEYAPFESVDPETDEIIGFDADIIAVIANEIGVDIEWNDVGFDTLVSSLAQGSFDCVIAAMTITEEREEQVDFTRWYFKSEQAVLVAVENPESIADIDDVNASTIKVGVQQGTTSDLYLTDNNFTTEVQSYNTITLAIQALKQGTIDVVLGDHATLQNAIANDVEAYTVVDTFSPEDFGIAVPDGHSTLLAEMNTILDELLGTDLDNPIPNEEYNTIFVTWMEMNAIGYVEPENTVPGFSFLGLIAAIPIGYSILYIKKRK